VLLDHNKFLVKSKTVGFSAKKSFEISDAETQEVLGMAKDKTTFFGSLLNKTIIEVWDASKDALVFTLSRTGFFFPKDQVHDAEGQLIGRYKAKIFSLSGGFNIYDKEGKPLGEIKGKMFKAEYKFVTPDKKTEMGSVSRTWAGLAKSIFTGGGTYVVQIDPTFATDTNAKVLMLGATIALETIFKKKKEEKSGGGSSESGGGDE
jgi:uncharacterized protein YxjI